MLERSKAKTLGIDPGGTCGWSDGFRHGELPSEEFLIWMKANVVLFDRVAIERFVTRKLTPDSEATLELIGAVKMLCKLHRVPYSMVNASARGKTMSQISGHIKGKHARDAEAVRLWDLQYGKW